MSSLVRLGISPTVADPTSFYHQSFWALITPPKNPGLCALSHSPVVLPGLSAHKCRTTQFSSHPLASSGPPVTASPAWSSSHCLALFALCPSYLSLTILPVWMDVSSLTFWLSDFHTVRFSGSSGYFLFWNFLLSFFWLCKEAKCIYLCLYLGQKSLFGIRGHCEQPRYLSWSTWILGLGQVTRL